MITDIPTADDLKRSAIDLLVMAWETALESIRAPRRSQMSEWDSDGSVRAKYDAARQPVLRHAHVWVHQAQELGLKSLIAEVSPYILLVGDPRTWPKPDRGGHASFSGFRTIDAADLVRVHDTVCPTKLPVDFVRQFEEGRRNRNKIVHLGGHGIRADAREVVLRVLNVAEILFSDRRWASYLMGAAFDSGEAVIASDVVEWGLLADFALIVEILTPVELRRHFRFEKKRRGYICLTCSSEERGHQDPSRFAQLVVNDGEQLFCPICTETHTVLREKCSKPGCRGSVLWASDYKVGTCLTCNHRNDARFRAEFERYFKERRGATDPASHD